MHLHRKHQCTLLCALLRSFLISKELKYFFIISLVGLPWQSTERNCHGNNGVAIFSVHNVINSISHHAATIMSMRYMCKCCHVHTKLRSDEHLSLWWRHAEMLLGRRRRCPQAQSSSQSIQNLWQPTNWSSPLALDIDIEFHIISITNTKLEDTSPPWITSKSLKISVLALSLEVVGKVRACVCKSNLWRLRPPPTVNGHTHTHWWIWDYENTVRILLKRTCSTVYFFFMTCDPNFLTRAGALKKLQGASCSWELLKKLQRRGNHDFVAHLESCLNQKISWLFPVLQHQLGGLLRKIAPRITVSDSRGSTQTST